MVAIHPTSSWMRLGVTQKERHIVWTHACGIRANLHANASLTDELLQKVGDPVGAPRADVVGHRGPASFDDGLVGAHDIANIADIAAGVEVADPNDRLFQTGFYARQLTGKARGRERWILSWPCVIERTGDEH